MVHPPEPPLFRGGGERSKYIRKYSINITGELKKKFIKKEDSPIVLNAFEQRKYLPYKNFFAGYELFSVLPQI